MTQADKRTDDKAAPWLYCYNEPYSEEGGDGRGFAGTGGHVKWSLTGLDETLSVTLNVTWSKGIRSPTNGSRKGPESLHPVRESHLSVSMR